MRKRFFTVGFALLFASILVLSVYAMGLDTPVSPEPLLPYIGVSSTYAGLVRLNNGDAQPYGSICLMSGYYTSATLSLYREGSSTPIASWYQSSSPIFIYETCSVSSGYTYYAILSAPIYDANDNYVDTIHIETNHISF